MTKLTFVDTPKSTTFAELDVGDVFTVKSGGLFIKTAVLDDMNAVVIVPVAGDDSYITFEAGHHSWWPSRGDVIRISALTATKES